MTAHEHGPPQPARPAMALLLCLTAAGMAGNCFALPLFMDVKFIFGSIFALLALQFLGPGRGLLAGFLISIVTYHLSNHPYNIPTLTLEVAVVGWLHSRRRLGLVAADTLYWCLVGIPLVFLFFRLAMHVPSDSVTLIAAKQAVNGIANALLARLIFSTWCFAAHRGRISFREVGFNLLALFVLAPSLLLLIIFNRTDFNDADQNIRRHLTQTNAVAKERVQTWLLNRQHPISYLAKLAETLPLPQMQAHLEQMRTADPNFLRIGLMDATATAIAYSPPLDDLGQQTIGRNFADRPYFDALRQSLAPQLSDIMPGKVGAAPGPIVAALHPVLVNGEFQGYVGGVLDLQSLKRSLTLSVEYEGMAYALLDRHDQVILSNDPAQQTMTPFNRGPGVLQHGLADGVRQLIPDPVDNMPLMERWQKSSYIVESNISPLSGWRLVVKQSMAPTRERLNRHFSNQLITLFLLLLAALGLASLLSRKVHTDLKSLQQVSSGLPAKIASGEPIAWPTSAFGESEQMIANFQEVTDTLKKKFVEITEMNATLEQRVADRTRKLQESEARYRELFEAESDAIVLVDNESGRILEANGAAAELYQYDHYEMLNRRNTDFSAEPEETKNVTVHGLTVKPGLIVKIPLRYHRKKDGTVFPVEITGRFFMLHGRSVHIAAIRDITERKQAEAAIQESEERFRKLLQHVPAVAVQGYTMDGTTFYWNDASEALYGYSAQEAIGLNLLNLIIPPAMRSEVREAMQQMAASGQPIPSAELSLMRKDGSLVTVFSSHAIVHAHGREPELFCIDVDMTQIKEAQEALQKSEASLKEAQRLAHIGSWSWDAEADKTWWSAELYRLLHFDPERPTPSYQEHLKIYTPASITLLEAAVTKAMQTGTPYALDLELANGNGGGRWLLSRGEAKRNSDGRIVGLSGTAQDITNRKQSEELLRRALKEKEVLVKEVHHRVKNNMQVIYSLLNLQAKGVTDKAVRTMFEESRNRVNSMALIHEQLYQAKDLAHIDFKAYLQSLIKSIADTYDRREITLTVEMTTDIALDVNVGIPCGLIVNELVSNSLKHAFPIGQAGTIRVDLSQGPEEECQLTVSDNGVGFPADLDFTATASLGLQLVNVLVGQLQGTITLARTAGSEFTITFPRSTKHRGTANG